MKGLILCALGVAAAASTFGAAIDISTGTGNANWQVSGPGYTGSAISLTTAEDNPSWAPAPTGSDWVSWGAQQGTSCVVGQTPGNGCANTNFNTTNGDTWTYTLTISAASLGATTGTLNFVFGSDDYVNLWVGATGSAIEQYWNQGTPTNGYSDLGCSLVAGGPGNAGNTQTSYSQCTSTITFTSAQLNNDGSLTLVAYDTNAPISGCPQCGNPSGFVLDGDIQTNANVTTPEPATFGMVALAGLAGLMLRRKQRS